MVGGMVESACRSYRSDPRQELQDAEPCDSIARVLGPTQERQHILDMGGLKEFQPTELDERNVAPGQFHLEWPAVMRGAEQDCLYLQRQPGFTVFQNLLDHVVSLIRLVADADEPRPFRRDPI